MQLRYQIDRLHHAEGLDATVSVVERFADGVLPRSADLRDVLHGTWLGHPLHPPLTDLVIGFWTSAVLLDLLGGERAQRAAEGMVGAGVLSALPTAYAGLADWQALGQTKPERRVGVVHALSNAVALTLFGWSWLARRRRRQGLGVALGLAGSAAATLGGYLGGHLAYRQAVGVDHQVTEHKAGEWTDIGPLQDIPENSPHHAEGDGAHLVVVRQGERVAALAAHCAHMAGPLHEGKIVEVGGQACLVCPWHGSTFALRDGSVAHGPATAPQPSYDTRVREGRVEVKARPLPRSTNGQISVGQLTGG